ncbi:MAG: tyrosine-type recombinase/integrase [Promethearchaeati archaeon SRVP18_Atabeyarchaeia-1]
MNQEIEAFLGQLKLRDTSDLTPKQYGYTLGMFRRFLADDRNIKKITRQDLAAFIEYLSKPSGDRVHKHAYRRSSIIATRACLSSFFQYMVDSGRITGSPMPRTARMARPPRNPIYLTEEEKERFLSAASSPREKLIVNLLVSTGMRMGELLSLKVKDIDLETSHLNVRLKRGAVRPYIIVPALIDEDAAKLIRRHVQEQRLESDDLLIHLSRRGLQYTVERVARKGGITKRISPHMLRHTFAVAMRRRNVRTEYLQNLLHHKNRDTTAIYEAIDMRDTEEELARLGLIRT